jgi:hypothetical protein
MFAQGVRKNLLIGSEPDGTNVCCSSRQIIQKMNGSAGFSRLGMRGRCVIITFRGFIESEILSNPTIGWSLRRLPLTS